MSLTRFAPTLSLAFKIFAMTTMATMMTMAAVAVMLAAMTLITAMFSRCIKFFFHDIVLIEKSVDF